MMRARRILASLILSFFLLGCSGGVGPGSNVVQGSGKVVTESRPVSEVTEVVLAMSGWLAIDQGDRESLVLEGEDNILPMIVTDLEGGRLTIKTRPNTGFKSTRPLNYRLTVKDLRYIGNTASGEVKIRQLDTADVRTEASGSGSIKIDDLTAGTYTLTVSGSGNISTSGQTESLDATLSGSGRFEGSQLQCSTAGVSVSGSGGAEVNATGSLDANVSGSGSIKYSGNPSVTSTDNGSGEIIRVK